MQILRELSMGGIVSRLAAVLLYAALQGTLLAVLARLSGDRRPQYEGRLTLNPFVHVSTWGAAMAALFGVSWVRSLWYDPSANRLRRLGIVLVATVGVMAMLALIPLVDGLQRLSLMLPRTGASAVLLVLDQLHHITLTSVMLNVLPLPGLVGGALLQALWPTQERRLKQAEPLSLAFVAALIVAFGFPEPGDVWEALTRAF